MTIAVNVLLVETDELELHERVEQLLTDGYAVDAVAAADQARSRLADGPDALILCGEHQTIGLLRELRAGEVPRADSSTPVLAVGADDDSAAVRYDRAGADVALPSESSPLLVAAGLEALMRRAGPPQTRITRLGSLTVDRDARTAQVDGRAVKLTRLEFDLLATLASEPRRTFTRTEEERLDAVAGAERRPDERVPSRRTRPARGADEQPQPARGQEVATPEGPSTDTPAR
jgi:DNA-binding response OmpR family regulator